MAELSTFCRWFIESVDTIIFSVYFACFIMHSRWFCMPTSPLSVMGVSEKTGVISLLFIQVLPFVTVLSVFGVLFLILLFLERREEAINSLVVESD